MKTGRNEPCPCGSGKKFKKCCGSPFKEPPRIDPALIAAALKKHQASEHIRRQQQGLGRPVIATKFKDHQLVAAGNTIYWGKDWKVFSDFLSPYLKTILGPEWGNAEIAKPLEQRHPIMQWYDTVCRWQASNSPAPGQVFSAVPIGAVNCYFGLAYNLYLLKHNVELQKLLLNRLKNVGPFQGAYYELIVANLLIRAGYELVLEDETDSKSKHCEFAAISKATGKRYWVEAKMRSVRDLLGKTAADGSNKKDVTSSITTHLRLALGKPASGDRLIFIDVNAPSDASGKTPEWADKAFELLAKSEASRQPQERAYVFVTNFPFHHHLETDTATPAMLGFGYGIIDFGKRDRTSLTEAYRRKLRHIDAENIGQAFRGYPNIPPTFDGGLQSEADGKPSRRVIIGDTYHFPDAGLIGTVTSATASVEQKEMLVGLSTGHILRSSMTDAEIEEYKAHSDAYFGEVRTPNRDIETPYEMFEWLIETHKNSTHEQLLRMAQTAPDFETFAKLSRDDLLLELCERWVAAIPGIHEANGS